MLVMRMEKEEAMMVEQLGDVAIGAVKTADCNQPLVGSLHDSPPSVQLRVAHSSNPLIEKGREMISVSLL